MTRSDSRRTRRAFLQGVGSVAAGATAVAATDGGRGWAPRARRGPTVAVLGGGVAGLTAAHELAERGFAVTVYERRAWGGKCRSVGAPGTAGPGRRALPGEHGFRIVFGMYDNLPDTLKRIPFGSNVNGVFDNLVPAPQMSLSRTGGHVDMLLPIGRADARSSTPAQLRDLLVVATRQLRLSEPEAAYFARRVLVFLSSGDRRRLGEWEHQSWRRFIGADRFSEDYRTVIAEVFTRLLQALRSERVSARSVGSFLEAALYNQAGLGASGPFDRVLDAPTNEAWIDPWVALLRNRGVALRRSHAVTGIEFDGGRIAGVRVQTPSGPRTVNADWYVCALPIERARRLWTPAMLAAEPSLARAAELETAWMNGIQLYLREQTPIVEGHVVYLDSPWALSSICQAQFWTRRDFGRDYGDGRAHDCLSVVISDWARPGVVYGLPARECTPWQIAREVWEQIKLHRNDRGRPKLADELLHSWRLDPGLRTRDGRIVGNEDPLVMNVVGARERHPPAATRIDNLVLAGDYVQADFEAQSMEAANESARRAVNALLERSGSSGQRCDVFPVYRPPEWEPLKLIDDLRYTRGQPNLFDTAPETSPA